MSCVDVLVQEYLRIVFVFGRRRSVYTGRPLGQVWRAGELELLDERVIVTSIQWHHSSDCGSVGTTGLI